MTRRTRTVLIDNVSGKIFSNTSSVIGSTSVNVIAQPMLRQTGFLAPSSATTIVAYNIGTTGLGLEFPVSSTITKVTLRAVASPLGSSIIAVVKSGPTYDGSIQIGSYELAAGSTSSVNTTNISITAGYFVYVDITQVGTTRSGAGFNILFTYYAG